MTIKERVDKLVSYQTALVSYVSGSFISSTVGRSLIGYVFWPCAEPVLLCTYTYMRYTGPTALWIPKPLQLVSKHALYGLGQLVNWPWIVEPIREVATLMLIEAVDVRYGPQAKKDLTVFFRLGNSIEKHRRLAIEYGGGKVGNDQNIFYPYALCLGPAPVPQFYPLDNDAYAKRNFQIAETAILFSVLAYRNDADIQSCMREGMLPDTHYHTVHLKGETDVAVFIGDAWAVISFRGTEVETIQDMLTSSLVGDPKDFGGNRLVRKRYYKQMLLSCGAELKNERASPLTVKRNSRSTWKGDKTIVELVQHLNQIGKKIYCVGHSLGGGLAILFGAYMKEHLMIAPEAVITFGAPPVAGNQDFVQWYNENVKSWRFVHGNEFGPLSPPLPFTSKRELQHVGKAIDACNLEDDNPRVRTYQENIVLLDELGSSFNRVSLFYDHNPVQTLRQLQLHMPESDSIVGDDTGSKATATAPMRGLQASRNGLSRNGLK